MEKVDRFNVTMSIGGPLFEDHIIEMFMLAAGLKSLYSVNCVPYDPSENLKWARTFPVSGILGEKKLLFWHVNHEENKFSSLETYMTEEGIYFKSHSSNTRHVNTNRHCIFRPGINKKPMILKKRIFDMYVVPKIEFINRPSERCMSRIYSSNLKEYII